MPSLSPRAVPGGTAWRLVAAATGLVLLACGDDVAAPEPPSAVPLILELGPELLTPGQALVVSGSGFGTEPSAVDVTFGELRGELVSVEPGRIVALVPRRAPLGRTAVRLRIGQTVLAAGTVTVVGAGPAFAGVSPGGGFTCAIRQNAGAYCWGAGNRGTLGTGEIGIFRALPQAVLGGGAFTAIGSGSAHACALDAGGAAWCWGRNDVGQLGSGAAADAAAPAAVAGGLRFASLSVGFAHTCALTGAGEAFCWGANESGQLGDGTREDRRSPVPVAGGLRFARVSAGGRHTCAVEAGGAAFCWGANGQGELGTGGRADALVPSSVAGGHAFVAITAGSAPPVGLADVGDHTCALTAAGEALCWGYNGDGQLGTGSFSTRETPTPVATDQRFTDLTAGAFYTCGISLEGTALCWGQNDSGQLGSGVANRSLARPVTVVGALRLRAIAAGKSSKTVLVGARPHTCALDEGGAAFCWGSNATGQLGDGQTGETSLPVPVVGG